MCSHVYVYGWLGSDFKEVAPGGGGRLLSKSRVEDKIQKNETTGGRMNKFQDCTWVVTRQRVGFVMATCIGGDEVSGLKSLKTDGKT